jgi:hypothetical protein
MPAGFGMTFVARLTIPENPFRLLKETVAVVVEPTVVVIAAGLTVSEKS